MTLKDIGNTLQNLFNGAGNAVNQAIAPHPMMSPLPQQPQQSLGQRFNIPNQIHAAAQYFTNPNSFNGNTFANSPVMGAMANVQHAIQTPQVDLSKFLGNGQSFTTLAPQIPQVPQQMANQPVTGGIMQAGRFVANGLLGAGTNVAGNIFDLATDQAKQRVGIQVPYNQLKSPVSRLLANANGQNLTPQQVIGNAAGVAEPIANLYAPEAGIGVIKDAVKKSGVELVKNILADGAITGFKQGALLNGTQSLSNNRNQDLKTQLLRGAGDTVIGGLLGAAFGAGTAGAGAAYKAIPSKVIGDISNVILQNGEAKTPQEAAQKAQILLRNKIGQFISNYTGKEPTFYNTGLSPQMESMIEQKFRLPAGNNSRFNIAESSIKVPPTSSEINPQSNIPTTGEGQNIVPNQLGRGPNIISSDQGSLPNSIPPFQTTPGEFKGVPNMPSVGDILKGKGNVPPPGGLSPDIGIPNPNGVERKFVTSVHNAPNVNDPTKLGTQGTYIPKPNTDLMGEAQSLLQSGAKLDLSKVQNADQKVAATIQEAINQQKKNPQLAANLFNNLSEQGTQLGRGVQAFSLLQKMSPESIALSAAGKIKQYNATAIRKIPELNGDQVKMIGDKVAQIQSLQDGTREKNIAINELSNTINQFIPSSIVDKAITVWKAGLLTSLRTHERNLLGNTIMAGSEILKDPLAAGVDRLMSLRTGQRSMTSTLKGTVSGAKTGIQSATDMLKYGYDPQETISKFDVNRISWGNNPVEQFLKRATDAVYRPLGAEDKVFWHSAYARSLYDQAGAEAMNAGHQGDQAFIQNLVQHPTEDMGTKALTDANYATFHDKSKLSGVANAIKQAATANGGISAEVGKVLTNVVAPFTGVPSSIVGKTIAYSPLGLVKGAVTAGRVLAGQVPELQRQAAQEIGRGVIGTGMFGLGAYLMSKGLMTGQSKDSKQADLWAAQGIQANSVLVNGKWRSINSIGPQILVMLAGAKAQEEAQKQGGSPQEYAASLGKDQLSQTFLAGVRGLLNALTDPARYGQSYIGNQSASLVPNIVKDASKAFDPNQRQNNTLQDYMTNSIPGLRNQNVVKRDVLGNVMKQEPMGIGAFTDLFNSKTPTQNPIANELARLDQTGNNATPSKANASQTVYGQKVKMTPQQLDQFMSKVSPQMQQQMQSIISSPAYQQLDDTQKANILSNITSGSKNNDMLINNILNGSKNPITIPQTGTNGTLNKYQLQAAKDAFGNGTQNFQDLGNIVLRKDASGNVTTMTKDAFNTALYEATIVQARAAKDSQTYLNTGTQLLNLYQKQLQDPNVDPLDKIQISNKMAALSKALGKGLGAKPKKIPAIKLMSTKGVKPFSLKLSKAPKLKIAKNSFKIAKAPSSASNSGGSKKSAFKISNPRIYLSTGKGSQRGIRKAAGISIPTSRHRNLRLVA